MLSWLFPSDEDRLAKARALMAQGRYEDARKGLIKCAAPEAEALYDACCKGLEKSDQATMKKQLAAQGFHGWKVEVTVKDPRRKAELEALITKELTSAGLDLGSPDIDQDAVKAAFGRADRKAQRKSGSLTGSMRLVPRTEAAR
jgi:hypothetical protein